jgi:hypothetical protein
MSSFSDEDHELTAPPMKRDILFYQDAEEEHMQSRVIQEKEQTVKERRE